jgi:periplasmic protein TonB
MTGEREGGWVDGVRSGAEPSAPAMARSSGAMEVRSVAARRRVDRRVLVVGLALSAVVHALVLLTITVEPLEWRVRGEQRAPRAIELPALQAVDLEARRPEPPLLSEREEPVPEVAAPPRVEVELAIAEAQRVPRLSEARAEPTLVDSVPLRASEPVVAVSPPVAGEYEQQVSRWVERQRQYPLAARRRGMEGTAIVRIQLDGDGALLEARLVRDTGHAVLDRAALEMIHRAAPYPRAPYTLASSTIEVFVPIEFTLSR